MRYLAYLLVLTASVSFFLLRNNNSNDVFPNVETAPSGNTQPIVVENIPPAEIPKETPKKPEIKVEEPKIDATTLNQIQTQINQAAEVLNNLEKKSSQQKLSSEELYTKAITRVVNFFCQEGSHVRVASGLIISPYGHILTNAHVGEGYDFEYECLIRQGSPARNLGYAKLVMFPSIYTNAKNRQEQAENDVSIWKLARPAGTDPLPMEFPYYSIDPTYYPEVGQDIATFSYPSELLGFETLLKNLNLFVAETAVMDFDRDLIISGTSLSSQVGSSGGVLVDAYTNNFAGLIFAVSKDEEIAKRKLFSLTPYSVDRVTQNETGLSLAEFLAK